MKPPRKPNQSFLAFGFPQLFILALLVTITTVLRGSLSLKTTSVPQCDLQSDEAIEQPVQRAVADAVIEKLAQCKTLRCLRSAHHAMQDKPPPFNFPHFFLIGFQKCATTSINSYLRSHPQILPSVIKEPHFFSVCQDVGGPENPNCFAQTEEIYIQDFLKVEQATEAGLGVATVDASADYAWRGQRVADAVYEAFPWVKIVIAMREPIARAISYKNMHTEQANAAKACSDGATLYECIEPFLNPTTNDKHRNYSDPLQVWLNVFPREQIHIVQFEELEEDPDRVLRDLKIFLGLDTAYPEKSFRNVNNRAAGTSGWPIKKSELQHLISLVRPDALKVAEILQQFNFPQYKNWMDRWEAKWSAKSNENCDRKGNCRINSDS